MSMSDLELLQLVDTVKEKQRGPKGEPGVGISSIEQFDETGFTFRLTDGSFKRINLPAPKDGEAGAVGPSGRQGEKGDPGRAGRDGSQGLPGRDGQDGPPGSSIETAVVNSNGHLLLGISDNSIIDVGRVVGPAGATGAVGATGLAGESGRDGAAVLSGPRGPQADDGVEGDHWIDISSAEFSFYKKNGEGWNKLAELRQVPRDLRVPTSGTGGGGSGGGSGGNGELQNTRTLPLINGGSTIRKTAKNKGLPVPGVLITQEDANQYFLGCLREQDVSVSDSVPRPPHQAGQLWFCTNPEDLTLYVFDGAVWVPAAPPVSLDGIQSQIDDALIIQSDLLGRVDAGEAKQSELTDRVSDGEIKQRQIELALEELSVTKGSVARYTVTETHIGAAIRNGELYVSSPNAADVQAISFAPFDINGQPTRPCNTGDIIEFVETARSVGEVTRYRIINGGDSQALVVEYISGNNDFVKGEGEEVYIYPQNEEGVSKDYVDGQDALLQEQVDEKVTKTGDTMTGHLKVTRPSATTSEYILSVEAPHLEDGKQVALRVTGNGKVKAGHDTSHAFMAVDANDVITKKYIDEEVVRTSGTQTLDSSKWKLQQPDSGGTNRNYIEIENQNMKLFHVQDCTDGADAWAANKGYVDSKVATTIDGLATEEYVDTEVAKVAGQTQAYWYCASHQTAENLQPGECFISDSNEHLYLHTTSANGVDLGVGSSERVFNIATLFSVHATNGNSMYCAKSDRINFGSGSNNYMRVAQDTVFFKQQLNQGTKYVLNIPGFTP